ncbi:MAG TPA: carbonic anhydrase [Myxococcales bacterium]|nr:carbonic anhydrase [Myxococcales bacterium]
MRKLIQGIVEFREKVLPQQRALFAQLAVGQHPDALFISCSDSRVAPNWFASTEPGDLFVVRNVGNLIPPSGETGVSASDEAEVAAIEFALLQLKVANIIVCGHSECGAMLAVSKGREKVQAPHLRSWLRHADAALQELDLSPLETGGLVRADRLSQINVLSQLRHIASYSAVREAQGRGVLRLHGWWFDIASGGVYAHDAAENRFLLIEGERAQRLLDTLPEGSR